MEYLWSYGKREGLGRWLKAAFCNSGGTCECDNESVEAKRNHFRAGSPALEVWYMVQLCS